MTDLKKTIDVSNDYPDFSKITKTRSYLGFGVIFVYWCLGSVLLLVRMVI